MSKESRLINSLKSRAEIKTPIASDIFLPNYSVIGNLKEKCFDFVIINPNGVYTTTATVFIAWAKAPLTITKLICQLDATTNQIAGDLKYADSFIGLANSTLINDFDTTSGTRTDTTITTGLVPEGKAIYLSFDSSPNSAIKQAHFHIEWMYN